MGIKALTCGSMEFWLAEQGLIGLLAHPMALPALAGGSGGGCAKRFVA